MLDDFNGAFLESIIAVALIVANPHAIETNKAIAVFTFAEKMSNVFTLAFTKIAAMIPVRVLIATLIVDLKFIMYHPF